MSVHSVHCTFLSLVHANSLCYDYVHGIDVAKFIQLGSGVWRERERKKTPSKT